jgi:hypothetical protein
MTKTRKFDRPIEHARVLFKLSVALAQDNVDHSHAEAVYRRAKAERILKKWKPETTSCDTEEAYDKFVSLIRR